MLDKNKHIDSGDNFLLYIPKQKHTVWEVQDNSVKLIFYHNKPIEKFMRWLVKKPCVSDMALDEIGSTVWQLIDGNNTIYDIGKRLEEKYGEKCEPVYDRLIMYIRYLVRKGWIQLDRGNQEKTEKIKMA